jgi:hypothetical protein
MQALKSAAALVRMETPVLYFYPTTPIAIRVTAEMKNGRITEWFPPPATDIFSGPASRDNIVTWRGTLLPPGDAAALAAVPPVSGAAGGHYGHARQVPDAWFVRATTTALAAEAPPQVHTEKLIFYRGAANFQPPWRPRLTADGALSLSGEAGAPEIRHAFPIRSNGQPSPATVKKWRAQMLAALTDSGLTADEARAVLATWNDHWFTEPGHRLLAVLPQAWVDTVLPLSIQPEPQRVTRVFVARFEVLTPETEQRLADLLKEVALADTATREQVARLKDLQLGRFETAALERVKLLHKDGPITQQQWHDAFQMLRTALSNSKTEQRTANP